MTVAPYPASGLYAVARAAGFALLGHPESAIIAGFPETGADSSSVICGLARADTTMKRTYQASKIRRARTHGFLVRMKSRGGRAVINARRAKGRKRLAV